MIQLALALESLGPMGAQVIHLFFCFSESVGPFWGPSDPLVFSRSSCQVLFGSVLSYFLSGVTLKSVSFSLLLLTEELLTRVSYLSLQKKDKKKDRTVRLCVFTCVVLLVCVCVLLFSCQYLVSFFLWPLLFLYSTDQY